MWGIDMENQNVNQNNYEDPKKSIDYYGKELKRLK